MSANVDLEASARRFLTLLPKLEVSDKRILDLRCAGGHACLLLAHQGARDVLGVDARDVSEARARLAQADPHVQGHVRFEQIRPDTWRPEDRRYDIVVSRGAFGCVAEVDAHVAQMEAALAPAGSIVIECAPRRRAVVMTGRETMTLERFADVMARSRLHCTWYRTEVDHRGCRPGRSLVRGAIRLALHAPIAPAYLRTTVVSVWRHPLPR
jgi:cyclopropane fatty-acyl-phospholipid synthase-like methyltransferase